MVKKKYLRNSQVYVKVLSAHGAWICNMQNGRYHNAYNSAFWVVRLPIVKTGIPHLCFPRKFFVVTYNRRKCKGQTEEKTPVFFMPRITAMQYQVAIPRWNRS